MVIPFPAVGTLGSHPDVCMADLNEEAFKHQHATTLGASQKWQSLPEPAEGVSSNKANTTVNTH